MKGGLSRNIKKLVSNAKVKEGETSEEEVEVVEEVEEVEVVEVVAAPKTEKQLKMEKRAFSTLLTLCGASLAVAIVGLLLFMWEQSRVLKDARIQARRETVRATLELDRELRVAQDTALSISSDLTSGTLPQSELLDRLKLQVEQKELTALGAAYDPSISGRYAPTYIEGEPEAQLIQLEQIYKYERPRYVWYQNTLSKGAHWEEPYIWPTNDFIKKPVVGFYSPFYNPDTASSRPEGVILAEYSVDTLREIMKSLDLGRTGYAFIISKSGFYVYHPNEQFVTGQRNLLDFANKENDPRLRELVTEALRGEPVNGELTDEVTGQDSWIFLRQSYLTEWVVGVVFIPDEVIPDTVSTRRKIIWVSLAFLSFFIFLSILLCRAYRGTPKRLWAASICLTALLILEIGFIWSLVLRARTYTSSRNLLLNDTAIDQLLTPIEDLSIRSKQEPPVQIPTGVFVQTLDFSSPTDVFVTGYIWQKYDSDIPKEVIPGEEDLGFIMPDSLDANDLDLSEAYRYQEGNVTIIGWYFEATLRQDFDYSYYPFDYKDVKIRLWPKDFNNAELNRQVVLVPDLSSYPVINPKAKPGVAGDIVVGVWDLNDSFFEYKFNSYNTNFGLANAPPKLNYPELHFTMILQRSFLGVFISRVGPQLVVITLLFAILFIATSENSMEVLGACGGFVFIVILDQITFREQIVSKGLVFLEYFYFLIYLYIFMIAINAIMLLFPSSFPIVKYKENLVSKLSSWPALTSLLLIITILIFG